MEQQYIVKERRYWYSPFRGLVADVCVVDVPAFFDEALSDFEWRKGFHADGEPADVWIEPMRNDAYVIQECNGYGGWVTVAYFESYQDAADEFERFAYDDIYRLVYADCGPLEDSSDDAYEAYRDHVRTESNILARRSRTW